LSASATEFKLETGTALEYVLCEMAKVQLEGGEYQPSGGRDDVFTVLFTSGSSGKPKGVLISAGGFQQDISARNFVEPLVTVSYIALSHSSDRLKLWEFLGNGGRIGFAHYNPTNWLAHEQSKKSEALRSTGIGMSNHGVSALFAQIQRMEPTAMAAPPNIWSGLYHEYLFELQQQQCKVAQDKCAANAAMCSRQLFGPRMKFLATGGALTAAPILQWAASLIPTATFSESYGATECGAIASNNRPILDKRILVKVGPIPVHGGVSLFPASVTASDVDEGDEHCKEGELWVSSPSIALGYLDEEEEGRRCFIQEGVDEFGSPLMWYKTGDLVRVSDCACYKERNGVNYWMPSITVLGRISSAVKLLGGAVVSPDYLESIFSVSPVLADILIFGCPKYAYLVAIVNVCRSVGVGNLGTTEHSDAVMLEIQRVSSLNALRPVDTPIAVVLEYKPWSIESGHLNGSFKKRRSAFYDFYGKSLEEALQKYTVNCGV